MAELNKIRFLLFFLLMIFPAHALDVILSSVDGNFKHKAEIRTNVLNGQKIYFGTLAPLTFHLDPDTSKVIVYIIDRSRFVEIMRNAVRETRFEIAQELKDHNYELVILGIDNFDDDECDFITAFMLDKIRLHLDDQANSTIETIGENHFDRVYGYHGMNFEKYQENAQICGGALQERLRAIRRGALRPVGSIEKGIRLYDFNRDVREERWPVRLVNGSTYSPKVDVNDLKYNFKIRYPNKKICLLILSGKEYPAVTRYGERLRQETEVPRILDEMAKNNDVLLILGAFNFDWTEIDILTQIIHSHSGGGNLPADNVFTCGYGMFNTLYLLNGNVNTGFPQQPKSNVSRLIKILMGEEVEERFIKMYYTTTLGYEDLSMEINSGNGRYIASEASSDYYFPWVNRKIVFIVCNLTDKNDQIDYGIISQCMNEVENNGFRVVLVEAENFGLDDMHIIAEWIDYHRGAIDSEDIAVLGGGIFDTIFQSESTTYKTLHNTKKTELKAIRDANVKSGNGKRIFAAQIDNPGFEVWTYPMNTVNGHYEPDLIPDENMFDTTGGRKIFFIITSANRFHKKITTGNLEEKTQSLKNGIEQHYSHSNWTVFLVGLDNFEERDYYLFAELVKVQTHDERFLVKFARTFNYGIGSPVYQYKDTRPIPSDENPEMQTLITSTFAASH